jgi:hypothetical protein
MDLTVPDVPYLCQALFIEMSLEDFIWVLHEKLLTVGLSFGADASVAKPVIYLIGYRTSKPAFPEEIDKSFILFAEHEPPIRLMYYK